MRPPRRPEVADDPAENPAGDTRPFLSRWSQRKRALAVPARPTELVPEPAAAPADMPADMPDPDAAPASDPSGPELPALETITAETDVTGFLAQNVTRAVRNAALRRVWALDPAIRDYIGDARDYGYDWNVPGGVPGFGPIDPGYDVEAMLSGLFSQGEPEPDAASPMGPGSDWEEAQPEASGDEPSIALPPPEGDLADGREGAALARDPVPAPVGEEAGAQSGTSPFQVGAPPSEPAPVAASPRPSVNIARRHGRATPI